MPPAMGTKVTVNIGAGAVVLAIAAPIQLQPNSHWT